MEKSIPTNFFTERPYSGGNAVALSTRKDPRWATYRQWLAGNYQVRKGEQGTQITVVVEDKDDKKKTSVRRYWVFNIEQADKIEEKTDGGE